MVAELEILAVAVACMAVAGFVRAAKARIAAHGVLLVWRWLSGQPWHGKPLTDAGWLRPATDRKALTATGYAPRFHYRPRWRRAASRTGRALALLLLAWLWTGDRHTARTVTLTALATVTVFWAWRAWRALASRKHRRTWAEPLHLVAAPLVGYPRALPAASWLKISPDRSRVVAELPPGFNPDARERERVVGTFTAKLGIESPDVRWQLAGPEPKLELTAAQPPPPQVTLADVREHLDRARPDDLIWGIGKRGAVVRTSLAGDSPHVGLSMGSGAGKSVTARALLAQMLYRGAIGLILDYKMISHQWARDLPNVAIARRPGEIHAALMWLGREAERRNEVALAGSDMDGNVHSVVGPRLIVVCEELNATVARLRAYWRQHRDGNRDLPQRSPALDALDAVSFMGRQILMNLVYIGQRLSVKASGGDGDARENVGVIAFGRYSASNWKMLAPDFAMPPKSLTPGRIQVVSDQVRETQGVLMTAAEARALATAGTVALCPAGMPCAPRVTGGPETAAVAVRTWPDLPAEPVVSVTELIEPAGLRLSEVARDPELLPGVTLAALRMARHRDPGFPRPVGQDGLAHLYDPLELAEWDARRR
jgi:hypothetical protein